MKPPRLVGLLLAFVGVASADSATPKAPAPVSCEKVLAAAGREGDSDEALRQALELAAGLPSAAERRACLRVLIDKHELPDRARGDEKLNALFNQVADRDSPLAALGRRAAEALGAMSVDMLLTLIDEKTTIRIDEKHPRGESPRGPSRVRGKKEVKRWIKEDRWQGDTTVGLMLCDERCCEFFPGSERHEHHYYILKVCFSPTQKLNRVVWERGE